MNDQTLHLGIDPGKSGGWCALMPDDRSEAMPFKAEDEFIAWLRGRLKLADRMGWRVKAALEQVGGYVRPKGKDGEDGGGGQPGSAMFRFGENYGWYAGVLQSHDVPFVRVRPQKWQQGLEATKAKGADKKRLLKARAAEMYPFLKPTLKTADAILIAHWLKHNS